MYCPHCGNTCDDADKFCRQCGKAFTKPATAPQDQPSVAPPAKSKNKSTTANNIFWVIVVIAAAVYLFQPSGVVRSWYATQAVKEKTLAYTMSGQPRKSTVEELIKFYQIDAKQLYDPDSHAAVNLQLDWAKVKWSSHYNGNGSFVVDGVFSGEDYSFASNGQSVTALNENAAAILGLEGQSFN